MITFETDFWRRMGVVLDGVPKMQEEIFFDRL